MTEDMDISIDLTVDEHWAEGHLAGRQVALADMAARIRENCINKGWRFPSGAPMVSFGEAMALLHSEVSEALEAYRDQGTKDVTAVLPEGYDLPKPEGVGAELADVLIRLLDTCDAWGIDLQSEVDRKMAYNETRPYRHGNKAL